VAKAATAIETIHFIFPTPQSVSAKSRDAAPGAKPNEGGLRFRVRKVKAP
jgi:hypothetical protein